MRKKLSIGDRIFINDNLCDELTRLKFDEQTIDSMKRFQNSYGKAIDIWTDNDGTTYVTVEECCEVPLKCAKGV